MLPFQNLILVDGPQGDVGELRAVCPGTGQLRSATSLSRTIGDGCTHQRKTPTLSTWLVARKSPVGEKVMDVATLAVLKASTSWPVGMSNVRIIESVDVVSSQRESFEKACRTVQQPSVGAKGRSDRARTSVDATHYVDYPSAEPDKLSHGALRLDVDEADRQIVAHAREEVVLALQQDRHNAVRQGCR